jgi:hypothetical protein
MILDQIVHDFAVGLKTADQKRPQARNVRSQETYTPGIGPHSEAKTTKLVAAELEILPGAHYAGRITVEVPYAGATRNKCDLCLGVNPAWEWAIEVKMLRLVGDNGKPNDNMLMHILSPYSEHRSALTDCEKLLHSGFQGRKAIIIYGYDHSEWPMVPAIEAFEVLARRRVRLGDRVEAKAEGLIHPIHATARVFGWEVAE